MPLTLPLLNRKKQQQQQQRRPTISQPFASTASPHPLPCQTSSPPSGSYVTSMPSAVNQSSIDPPPLSPLRPAIPPSVPDRAYVGNEGTGAVRRQDLLVLPQRQHTPRPLQLADQRLRPLPELAALRQAGDDDDDAHRPASAGVIVEFETATVFTSLAREDPELCARWARMAVVSGSKGFPTQIPALVGGGREVDLEVVDAFLEVALEQSGGMRARLHRRRRRRGIKRNKLRVVGDLETGGFGEEEGLLRPDRRQAEIIRGLCAFPR